MQPSYAIDLNELVTEECDPTVAEGLHRFFAAVTLPHPSIPGQGIRHPSFSLTSRRYSIWTKLREHLEAPISQLIGTYPGSWENRLLEGFTSFTIGRNFPTWRFDAETWAINTSNASPIVWADLVVPFRSPHVTDQRTTKSETDKAVERIRAWDQNLRFVIHSALAPGPKSATGLEERRFLATVESLRLLLELLKIYRAKRGADPWNTHEGTHPHLPDGKTRGQAMRYCELCWRPSMRSAALGRRYRVPDIKSRQLSDRFCIEHDPSDPTSRYRVDYRYKKVFLQEALYGKWSQFLVHLALPTSPSKEESRKTAYARAHARLRPLSKPESPSFREQVWSLHQKGMRQVDIARQLGTSRQSISKSLKRTKELVVRYENRRDMRPQRVDYGRMAQQSLLVEMVENLHEDGYTPAEIARMSEESLATIFAVLQWLGDNPRPKVN